MPEINPTIYDQIEDGQPRRERIANSSEPDREEMGSVEVIRPDDRVLVNKWGVPPIIDTDGQKLIIVFSPGDDNAIAATVHELYPGKNYKAVQLSPSAREALCVAIDNSDYVVTRRPYKEQLLH